MNSFDVFIIKGFTVVKLDYMQTPILWVTSGGQTL